MSRLRRAPALTLLRLLPRVDRGLALLAALDVVVGAALPTAAILAGGALVGAAPGAAAGGPGSAGARRLWIAFAVVVAVYFAQQILAPLLQRTTTVLGERVDDALTHRFQRLLVAPATITHLEDAEVADEISVARQIRVGEILAILLGMWASRLTGLASGLILLGYRWWVGAVLLIAPIALLQFWRAHNDRAIAVLFGRNEGFRRALFTFRLGTLLESATEVRLFGLRNWLGERLAQSWTAAMAPVRAERRSRRWHFAGAASVPAVLQAAAAGMVALDAASGRISLGQLATFLGAIATVTSVGTATDMDRLARENLAAMQKLLDLEARLAPEVAPRRPAPVPRRAISFENVSFTYPGRTEPVLRGLDLTIEVGRSVAIVGVNGAGKSTLVSLLCLLREPEAGRITVDGVDLATTEAASWQRQVAAVFQGFGRYRVSAADNIAFGAPERSQDRAAIRTAAERAGIAREIETLPKAWDTPLSRQLTGGSELSGGQWQRVAIARAQLAMANGASVLVLDEPTASLDVRTEAELVERFLEFTKGVTTIVVSHRFSTVRQADRIVVVDAGRITEDGTHEELVAHNGVYAELFALQAARFAGREAEDA